MAVSAADKAVLCSFQKSQIAFYEDLLAAWEVPLTRLPRRSWAIICYPSLLYETMPQPLSPFYFWSILTETAALKYVLFIGTPESLRLQSIR